MSPTQVAFAAFARTFRPLITTDGGLKYLLDLNVDYEDDKPLPVPLDIGDNCGIWEPTRFGMPFAPQKNGHLALHVDDVEAARKELEAKGVEFAGETLDTGVCHMAFFTDPDGNDLMLHSRYAPVEG